MSTIGYYPGCSLSGGGIELNLSIRAIAAAAGVELREIDDWNCCGATAAHSLNHELGVALPYRILALAEAQGLGEVLAPCAACFSRLKGTNVRLGRSEELARRIGEIVAKPYSGAVRVLSINEFIGRLLSEDLAAKLPAPLGGLKVACYYGCLLSRGADVVEGDDHETPTSMEAAVRAAGCEPVAWNFATECCGGGFSMSKTDAVLDLSQAILAGAQAAGADMVVTGCPMCHSNLDMRQMKLTGSGRLAQPIPVLYVSELLGLAAGVAPKALGLNRHFTSAMSIAARRP